MTISDQSILVCWIVLAAYWVIRARTGKPVAERNRGIGRVTYKFLTVLGGFLLCWPSPPHPLGWLLLRRTALTAGGGAVACFLGLGLAIWSRHTIASNWNSGVVFKHGHELVQHGPYRLVRHPIYSGILLMALGSAVAGGRLASLLGFAFLFAGFWVKLRQEEGLMARHFPEQYLAYRARTKALVPFVW